MHLAKSTRRPLALVFICIVSACGNDRRPPTDPEDADPGKVTLRRLNRTEYNNTVRDLLGTTQRPADAFPYDDLGYGFDNIGDVLGMSPTLVDQYWRAAGELVAELQTPATAPTTRRVEAESAGGANGGVFATTYWRLVSNGAVDASYAVPVAGRYRVTVRAFGQQAGPALPRMRISLGTKQTELDVPTLQAAPAVYSATFDVPAGGTTVAAAFVNDFRDAVTGADRNLVIDWIEVRGPVGGEGRSERWAEIAACAAGEAQPRACADEIVRRFGRRAWRRPLTDEEVSSLAGIADAARADGATFEAAVGLALRAILSSPHFLFLVEIDPDPTAWVPRPLTAHELAARLSYFLWRSLPDAELDALADDGSLTDSDVLAAQVDRMLADDKARSMVDGFGAQWLQLRALDEHDVDATLFPAWNAALREKMRAETERMLADITSGVRPATDVVTATTSYMDQTLAAYYGLAWPGGDGVQPVPLGSDRIGVLTHGAILALTSYPNRTAPVKRGKWVLEQLLCSAPPPPPPGVEGLPPPEDNPNATMREIMEAHRANPACASCHVEMDPIGFTLERFDAIGRIRDTDRGLPIDTSAMLGDAPLDGAVSLGQAIAADARFARCVAEKMFVYALGRGPLENDHPTLDALAEDFAAGGYVLPDLVRDVALSPAFRFRRPAR